VGLAKLRLHLSTVRDVDTAAEIVGKLVIAEVSCPIVQNFAIYAVTALEAIDHREQLARLKGRQISLKTTIDDVGMDILSPPLPASSIMERPTKSSRGLLNRSQSVFVPDRQIIKGGKVG
jgi:hypothetical protein